MSPRIAIVNYGLGNLFSVSQALRAFGATPMITASPTDLIDADAIVLPGVGAFERAMSNLRELKLVDPLKRLAMQSGKPIFGICLGMQLLFEESEEFGSHGGLGILSGRVKRFPAQTPLGEVLRVPNIGWRRVLWKSTAKWLGDVRNAPSDAYFVHSFRAEPQMEADVAATSNYGGYDFCSAVQHDNIFATQYHPEKSGKTGLKLWSSWLTAVKEGKINDQP